MDLRILFLNLFKYILCLIENIMKYRRIFQIKIKFILKLLVLSTSAQSLHASYPQ